MPGGGRVLARCDAAIIGGGAAGLLLAVRMLGAARPPGHVVLIDDGRHPLHERAWAFWAPGHGLDGRGQLAGAVSQRWSELDVHAAGERLRLRLDPYHYQLVRGGDLLAAAGQALAGAPLSQITGHVTGVLDGPDVARVGVDGAVIEAGWVFDSRPPAAARQGEPQLGFLGWEIATPVASFDPTVATLMDFRLPGRPEAAITRFCYVLPTAPDRALVELACIGWSAPAQGACREALSAYLRDTLGLPSWSVTRAEAGWLPLYPAWPRRRGHRVLAIGRPAGILKPSTGYGFQRADRDARAVVASLARRGHPFDLPRPRWRHRVLDRLMLEVIRREQERIEPALAAMFARNPPARVLRFLDEDTTLAEELRLVATMPPAAFARAAARLLLRR